MMFLERTVIIAFPLVYPATILKRSSPQTSGGSPCCSSMRDPDENRRSPRQDTESSIFTSESFASIREELDTVPLFCCANAKGQPLQYNVNNNNNADATTTITMPFFYCDVMAVEMEFLKAKKELPKDISGELRIIPFPLGQALELMVQNQAMIVPSKTALQAAGAPPEMNPLGQPIPVFCCMDITQESPEGKPVLPLFLVYSEAEFAIQEAVTADGGDPKQFDIVSLSLERVVEMFATDSNSPSFQFLPPRASIDYIEQYLNLP